MKQFGLLVFTPKTLQSEAYYSVWSDLHETLEEVIEEADELEQERSGSTNSYSLPRPEAIFEYDSETGEFKTGASRSDLFKLLVVMNDSRKEQRRDELSDDERREEDSDNEACERSNFLKGTTL
ncbi:unnamed protein product [Sphagnum balticum]